MTPTLQERIEPRREQVVDWSSALLAGLVAGAVFFLALFFLAPLLSGFNGWVYVRLTASLVRGDSVLAPPATFDGSLLALALVVHFGLSILSSLAIAFVFHRWGFLVGILGGGLFGCVLYGIGFFAMTAVFPWLVQMRGVDMLIGHILFGAVAGGVYEALEVEEWVEVDGDEE